MPTTKTSIKTWRLAVLTLVVIIPGEPAAGSEGSPGRRLSLETRGRELFPTTFLCLLCFIVCRFPVAEYGRCRVTGCAGHNHDRHSSSQQIMYTFRNIDTTVKFTKCCHKNLEFKSMSLSICLMFSVSHVYLLGFLA